MGRLAASVFGRQQVYRLSLGSSGYPEIWVSNSDGSGSHQLTRMRATISAFPRWSPDGKQIVFHSRPAGYANIYVINVETGAYRQLTMGPTEDFAPSWSHDGKWIYFGSERDGGEQIWRVLAYGGPASRVTSNGGEIALESWDGTQIFYSKPSDPGLFATPVEGGAESRVRFPCLDLTPSLLVSGASTLNAIRKGGEAP
jgi:Tol biopolymer transport system component